MCMYYSVQFNFKISNHCWQLVWLKRIIIGFKSKTSVARSLECKIRRKQWQYNFFCVCVSTEIVVLRDLKHVTKSTNLIKCDGFIAKQKHHQIDSSFYSVCTHVRRQSMHSLQKIFEHIIIAE